MTKVLNNNDNFQKLRLRHPRMIVYMPQYSLLERTLSIELKFELENGPVFTPHTKIIFPQNLHVVFSDKKLLEKFIANIAMVESISYWKAACPPEIITSGFSLTEDMALWWKKLFTKGLAEFFYTNNIKPTSVNSLLDFSTKGSDDIIVETIINQQPNTVIVPIGGGKDSIVSLDLLQQGGYSIIPLIMNPRGATLNSIKVAGFHRDEIIEVQRGIDQNLLDLNDQKYLNGHTPFSAMLAFYCVLAAYLADVGSIALSNESSANESTVPGQEVNHQYSKSFEFESDFRDYIKNHVVSGIEYFSFLRPLSELQIAFLFSKLSKYHSVFRSCNVGSKSDEWCGHCSKCLFTAIILSPFLNPDHINKIFNKSVLNDSSLISVMDELTGFAFTKPFDCVGTIDEVKLALKSSLKYYKEDIPVLVKHFFDRESNGNNSDASLESALTDMNMDHFVPDKMLQLLLNKLSFA